MRKKQNSFTGGNPLYKDLYVEDLLSEKTEKFELTPVSEFQKEKTSIPGLTLQKYGLSLTGHTNFSE